MFSLVQELSRSLQAHTSIIFYVAKAITKKYTNAEWLFVPWQLQLCLVAPVH